MSVKDKKHKTKYKIIVSVVSVFLYAMAFLPICVYAADIKILNTIVCDGSIYIYIRGIDTVRSDSTIQIGNILCNQEQVETASISALSPSMRTLVLIDNSKSIPEKNYTDIQNILQGIVSSARENEQIRIGTFSDDIAYLCDYTNDYKTLNEAIDRIVYQDQDTYLSDILYEVISELKKENTYTYTRILIFADGADNKSIGYTNDEVRDYIGENGYPIYTVGIPTKKNASELETMFSFSRAAKSEYFLLDESISDEDIVSGLLLDQSSICLKLTPQESLKDGSTKSILLKLSTSEGVVELTTSANMPFGTDTEYQVAKAEESTEKAAEEEVIPTIKLNEEPAQKKAEDTGKNFLMPVLLGVMIVLLILFIAAVVLFKVKKSKKNTKGENTEQKTDVVKKDIPTIISKVEDTVFDSSILDDDAKGLWNSEQNYLVVKDMENANIMFKIPITDVIHIGRSETSDIVIDNPKVSREHCEIILRGNLLYIKDCNSKNKTYYENVVVYGETPIVSGGKIKIGGRTYQVELVKG